MKLTGIQPIYHQMRAEGLQRTKFEYSFNRIHFKVIFFIDTNPFELLFGKVGSAVAFTIALGPGFNVATQWDKELYKIIFEALELQYDPNSPFLPVKFLEHFNAHIPQKIADRSIEPEELIDYYSTNIEDPDKRYFKDWKYWTPGQKPNVTDENLHKTRRLLGERVYHDCKRRRISSCWTADQKLKKKFFEP